MAIGHCINCDKEIFRRVEGKWEDLEYHSITFLQGNGSYIRFGFCKECHDSWENKKNKELKPKILKHLESMIRKEMEPFFFLEIKDLVTKDGPLDEEDKQQMQVVDGGLICR